MTSGAETATAISARTPENAPPVSQRFYLAIAAAAVAGYWLPRLSRGFWTDETLAYWISHDGVANVFHNLLALANQSIPYSYIAALFASHGPFKEALLRIPSLAGALLAAWLMVKLADQIVGRGEGILSLVPFICSGAIVQAATEARPYSLALAAALASFWSLREWVHRGKSRSLAIYWLSSCLAIYFHYLFAMIFVVQAVYVVAARRSGRVFRWTPLAGAGAAIVALLLPILWILPAIRNYSRMNQSAWKPSASDFFGIFPINVLLVVAAGLALYRLLHAEWMGRWRPLAKDDVALLASWALLGPVILFVAARSTSYLFFSTRYLLYVGPPCFILAAWAMTAVRNERAKLALAVAIALNAALVVPWMTQGDWRTTLAVSQQITDADTPLLVTSGCADSAGADLRDEPKSSSFLFAPLLAYPVRNPIVPLPFYLDAQAAAQVESEVEKLAPTHRRFCLLAAPVSSAMDLLPAWFREHGYRSAQRDAGGYRLVLFERISE